MNVSQLYAEIGRLLNDPNNTRWTTDVLLIRMNQAQIVIQNYTRAVKTKETLTPTAGSSEVTVDSDTLNILRVTLTLGTGSVKVIEGITREELDYRYPNWMNLGSGEPDVYWFDATNAKINLVRAPDSSNATTNGLSVWEVQKPTDLASDSDIPFDSNTPMVPYHMAIAHWVVAQCWMDDATPEALAKARFHRSEVLERPGEFEKHIMRIRADFDMPRDIPAKILWRPQGGRLGRWGRPSKSYPFSY